MLSNLTDSTKKILLSVTKYSVPTMANMVTGMLVLPIILVKLTPEELGVVSVAEAGSMFLVPIFILLIDQGVIRFSHSNLVPDMRTFHFHSVLLSGACVIVLGGAVLVVYSTFQRVLFPIVPMGILRLIVASTLLQAFSRVLQAILRSVGRDTAFAVAMTIRPISNLVLLSITILVMELGARGYALSQLLSFLVSLVLLMAFTIPHLRFDLRGLLNTARLTFSYSLPIIPGALLSNISNHLDRWILQFFFSGATIGSYSMAVKFANIFSSLITGMKNYFQPMFFEKVTVDGKTPKIVSQVESGFVSAAIVLAVVVSVFAADLIYLSGSAAYGDAIKFVPWVVFAVLAFNLPPFMANGYLFARKTAWSTIAATISLIVFTGGVVFFGGVRSLPVGIGIARLFAKLTSTIILILVSARYTKSLNSRRRVLIAASVAFALSLVRSLLPSGSYTILLSLLIASSGAFATFRIVKLNSWAIR